MDEKLYQANIKLVDENTTLKKDVSILEKRIRKAIECINLNICGGSISNAKEVADILEGIND